MDNSKLSKAAKRLQKELYSIRNDATNEFRDKITVSSDCFHWNTIITGPENSPYENGQFGLDITFTEEYPFKPVMLLFLFLSFNYCYIHIFDNNNNNNSQLFDLLLKFIIVI